MYLPVGKYCVYPRMVYRQAVAYIEYDLYPFHIATNLHGVFIAQYIALRHESAIVVHTGMTRLRIKSTIAVHAATIQSSNEGAISR